MKLQRFIAASNQKVIEKIQKTLGLDALIYSTRNVPGGIEMLAAVPDDDNEQDMRLQNTHFYSDDLADQEMGFNNGGSLDAVLLQKLQAQLRLIDENLKQIHKQVSIPAIYDTNMMDDERLFKRNWLYCYLNKLGFRGKFCQTFSNYYFKVRKISDNLSESSIKTVLAKYLKVQETEIIDERNICALVGPTGIGKTTTIAKMAKRFIDKFGNQGLGLITTDYNDIICKNQLYYYSQLFDVQLEYANEERDLQLALDNMRDKRLILIDTHGVSQRDSANVNALISLIEGQQERISTYLTLPCNIQEPILDEIARSFKHLVLQGAILTKEDECISMASALSVCMNYKLPITYICHGQDIDEDITCANAKDILRHIFDESGSNKNFAEENLFSKNQSVQDYTPAN